MSFPKSILTLLILLKSMILFGQFPDTTRPSEQGGQGSSNFVLSTSDELDTLPIYFRNRSSEVRSIYRSQSLVKELDHQYDLTRKRFPQHLNLSNQGSSAIDIEQGIHTDIDYDIGFHQYDPYKKDVNQLKYFRIPKAISDLYFSPKGQGNFIVKALFANSFSNDVDFTLDYHRINERGAYTNQNTKSTSVSAGLFFGKHSRFKTHLEFHANNHNEVHNGGVSDKTVFNAMFNSNRLNIPVFLSGASSRHESFNYIIQENILLSPKSSLLNSELVLVSHYEHGYNRFFDGEISSIEREVYQDFVLDDRGIRTNIGFKKIKNDLFLKSKLKETVLLDLGLKYNLIKINDEVIDTVLNNLSLFGKVQINLTKNILLTSDLSLGLSNNAGAIGLKSKVSLPWKEVFKLEAGIDFSRLNPSYLSEHLHISGQQYWDNSFSKPIHTQLWASLGIPRIKTTITAAQGVSDNVIYYNDAQAFSQFEDVYTFSKLKIDQKLKFKSLNLDHGILLQTFNENIFGFPEIFIDQRLYLKFNLFKNNLSTQMGVEHRYLPKSSQLSFQPIVGQFYRSNEEISYYPQIDFFSMFNVSQFNFTIRVENIYNMFSDEIYFPISNYPAYDFRIRIAAGWFIRN